MHGPSYWNRMVERALNERSAAAAQHLFLGNHFDSQMPLLLPLCMLERHALIYGPPGSGKTVLASQIVTQLIAMGHNVIVIDCKGSTALLSSLLHEARFTEPGAPTEVPYDTRVFNPFGLYPSHIYNPCLQQVWTEEPPHARTETLLNAFGIRGDEGTDTAFFAAMGFLYCTDMNSWFPDIKSASEFFALVNDRHLYSAKGGNPNDWNHSRHIAASLRQASACGALNAIPDSPDQAIELTDIFTSEKPALYYFYLSAIEDQRTSDMIGRLVLQQLKKAAFRTRYTATKRKTFVICDEAQELFGPMFGNALEQLREFNVSLLMFHQSRAQLVTACTDFRERFENAIGLQLCLGVRTPEDFAYLRETDSETKQYSLSWTQPMYGYEGEGMLHPSYSYQRSMVDPQLIGVSEQTVPRLSNRRLLRISADPQAGFVRGFLNERLWAFDAAWVPFRWFHHLTRKQFDDFSTTYPKALPGQAYHPVFSSNASKKDALQSLTTKASPAELSEALKKLGLEHRNQSNPHNQQGDSDGNGETSP